MTEPQRVARAKEAEAAATSLDQMKWLREQTAQQAKSLNVQTITTSGVTNYQPTVVTSGTTALNFSGASLISR